MREISKNILRIEVPAKIQSYDIVFGNNLLESIAQDLKKTWPDSRFAIISDTTVFPKYGESLEDLLKEDGMNVNVFLFAAGEKRKTRETKKRIENAMLRTGLGRDTVVIALGGGVVGDLAGYLAATYMRGVPFVQIATTFVAQADSAVGGKLGVDTPYGKNLIGVIKQPDKVYIDVQMLLELLEVDYRCGLAETIKHGIILDGSYFDFLEKSVDLILKKDLETLLYIAKQNCRIKGGVVEKDSREKGLRMILNFGHTLAHALEKLSAYSLPHGHAVSIGIMGEGRISNLLGYLSQTELKRMEDIFLKIGLPVAFPREYSAELIIQATLSDKKSKGGCPRYVLPESIGSMRDFNGSYATYVDDRIIKEAIEQTR